jgi:hypothetical protein
MTWTAESLRLTAFSTTPVTERVNWWHDLFGDAPETSTVSKKSGIAEVQEAGPLKPGRLALRIQINRIDWVWSPSEEQAPDFWPSLGTFTEVVEGFVPLMQKWLAIAPPLNRLAFGAVLMMPVDSREHGYRLLGERYLPALKIDPVGSSDLNYQINRPRPSRTLPNLAINRLSKWSVLFVRRHLLGVQGDTMRTDKGEEPRHFCRLELDLNTAPIFDRDLAGSSLGPAFDELRALALEIAERGDIP